MDTFRVTPPFGGVGHWEGNGKHWEKFGSGYGQVSGDVWWELEETKDEGYDDPDIVSIIDYAANPKFVAKTFDDNAYSVGDEYTTTDGIVWDIYKVASKTSGKNDDMTEYRLWLQREITTEGQHHEILNDYWNTYIYRNLEWTKTNTDLIKRSHV